MWVHLFKKLFTMPLLKFLNLTYYILSDLKFYIFPYNRSSVLLTSTAYYYLTDIQILLFELITLRVTMSAADLLRFIAILWLYFLHWRWWMYPPPQFISKNKLYWRLTQEDWFFLQKYYKVLKSKEIYLLGSWIWKNLSGVIPMVINTS